MSSELIDFHLTWKNKYQIFACVSFLFFNLTFGFIPFLHWGRWLERLQRSYLLLLIWTLISLISQKCFASLLQHCSCYIMMVKYHSKVSQIKETLWLIWLDHVAISCLGQTSEPSKGIFGAGAHSDFGLITLLATDHILGL